MSARLDLFAASDAGTPTATRPLFPTAWVAAATLVGSPMAGGVVMASNARQLGGSVVVPLGVGLGILVAQVIAHLAIGGLSPLFGIPVMVAFARWWHDEEVTLKLRQGAPRASVGQMLPILAGGYVVALGAAILVSLLWHLLSLA